MKTLLIPIIALAASSAAAAAAPEPQPPIEQAGEARIPFVGFRTIRTFRAVGDDVLYFQDRRRNWYRADLYGPCINLPRALRIGVDTRYGDTLDNSATIIVDGESCRIQSLVRSEPPPPRRRRRS